MKMTRQTAMIVTAITALCCGLPGCLTLCMGTIFAFAGGMPGSDIDVFGSSDPAAAIGFGLFMLCMGIIMIAIPIVTGVVTLRNKPDAVVDAAPVNEYIPPAS
jgi:hypothetical protein